VLWQVLVPGGRHRDERAASRRTMTRDEPPVVGLFPDRQARTRRPPRLNRLGVGAGAGAQPLKQVQNQALGDVGHKGFCGLAQVSQNYGLMVPARNSWQLGASRWRRRNVSRLDDASVPHQRQSRGRCWLARSQSWAKRSRRPTPAHERSPSIAIIPIRRPWLPDQATAAGPSTTRGACKTASSAIPSKRSAALATRRIAEARRRGEQIGKAEVGPRPSRRVGTLGFTRKRAPAPGDACVPVRGDAIVSRPGARRMVLGECAHAGCPLCQRPARRSPSRNQ
jgi:hypothetical protein